MPGSLVAIIVMTLLAALFKQQGWAAVETIGDRFAIQSTLPQAQVPALSWEVIKQLFPAAITIAVLGAIESLLSPPWPTV